MTIHHWRATMSALLVAGVLTVAGSGLARAADTVSFGVPPWPGVSMKTEVTEQLLDALGYDTETQNLGVPFIYRGLANGEIGVFMGAWLPAQQDMLERVLENKEVVKLGSNLSGAIEGLAVPSYVWDSGIHSIEDLAAAGDRFDYKIHGIESGSAMNSKIAKAIADDYQGLGDWQLVPSSTAAMLAEVEHSLPKQQPVVFLGWRPHWMNIEFDMRYLEDKPGSPIAGIESQVLTLVSSQLDEAQPNVVALLRNGACTALLTPHRVWDGGEEVGRANALA